MFTRLIEIVAILFIAVWFFQVFLVRARARTMTPRQYARYDLAPILAFFGAILLVLSFVEATRREAIDAWSWGIGLGFLMSGGTWVVMVYRSNLPAIAGASAWRAVWRFARTYGTFALIAFLGVYLSVRVVGAALGVFLAAGLGMLLITIAVAVFTGAWRKKIQNS
ncbi:MAG: hypothetical protein HY327_10360 [Chloroflexi bacterium]|nr:hypothetical protein [Chloroflexota bacterium]